MSPHDDLKAFIDGELDAMESQEMREALEKDPLLKREHSQLLAITGELRQLESEIAVQGLDKTLAALQRAKKPQGMGLSSWVYGLCFAATAVVFAAILFPVFSQAKNAAKRTSLMAFKAKRFIGSDTASASAKASAVLPDTQTMAVPREPTTWAQSKKALASDKPRDEISNRASKPPAIRFTGKEGDARRLGTPTVQLSSSAKKKPPAPIESRKNADANKVAPQIIASALPQAVNTTRSEPLMDATVISLSFASISEGSAKVLAIGGRYQVFVGKDELDKIARLNSTNSTTAIVMDVPEVEADKTIESFKQLTDQGPSVGAFGNGIPGKVGERSSDTVHLTRGQGRAFNDGNQLKAPSREPVSRAVDANGIKLPHPLAADSNTKASSSGLSSQPKNVAKSAYRADNPSRVMRRFKALEDQQQRLKPRTRRIVVVIQEKPKQDPVP